MANVRINLFENISLGHNLAVFALATSNTRLMIQYVYIPGSISFNTIAVMASQGHTSASGSFSFGLYSLSGSTLSLANSASGVQGGANGISYITLATSATQDITPGDWFLGLVTSSSGNNSLSLLLNPHGNDPVNGEYGGPLFRGVFNTEGLPASLATSDVTKEGNNIVHDSRFAYILISA